jgi:hypothetical protein
MGFFELPRPIWQMVVRPCHAYTPKTHISYLFPMPSLFLDFFRKPLRYHFHMFPALLHHFCLLYNVHAPFPLCYNLRTFNTTFMHLCASSHFIPTSSEILCLYHFFATLAHHSRLSSCSSHDPPHQYWPFIGHTPLQ